MPWTVSFCHWIIRIVYFNLNIELKEHVLLLSSCSNSARNFKWFLEEHENPQKIRILSIPEDSELIHPKAIPRSTQYYIAISIIRLVPKLCRTIELIIPRKLAHWILHNDSYSCIVLCTIFHPFLRWYNVQIPYLLIGVSSGSIRCTLIEFITWASSAA